MTVVHLISGLESGGAEHLVLQLCRQSARAGGPTMIVVSLSSRDTIGAAFRKENIPVYFLGVDRKRDLGKGMKQFAAIVRPYRDKPVLIHAHMFHAAVFAAAARILLRIPVVFTLHNYRVPEWHRQVLLFLTRPFRRIDTLLPGQPLPWFLRNDAVAIANGIEPGRYDLPANRPELFTCLFIGRVEKQKNPFFLITIANALRERYRFVIRVVGEGEESENLRKQVADNNLEPYFEWLGYREDIPQLMASSHCLLLPSFWEGMPLVVLEAGAAGLPVIATPVGSLPYILDDDMASLCRLPDFPGGVAGLIDNYPQALARAGRFRDRVRERYSIDTVFPDYVETLYHPVAGTLKKPLIIDRGPFPDGRPAAGGGTPDITAGNDQGPRNSFHASVGTLQKLLIIVPRHLPEGVIVSQHIRFARYLEGRYRTVVAIPHDSVKNLNDGQEGMTAVIEEMGGAVDLKTPNFQPVLIRYASYRDIFRQAETPDWIYTRHPRDFLHAWFRKRLTGKKWRIWYDFRALIYQEVYYRTGSAWKKAVYAAAEFLCYRLSDTRGAASEAMAARLREKFGERKVHITPSCIDSVPGIETIMRHKEGGSNIRLVYAGSMHRWQCFPDILRVVEKLPASLSCSLTVFTEDPDTCQALIRAGSVPAERVRVITASAAQVLGQLPGFDFGFLVRENIPVNQVASPVKFVEYCSRGVIPILTEGIGDFSEQVRLSGAGILLDKDLRLDPSLLMTMKNNPYYIGKVLELARQYTWAKRLQHLPIL